MVDTLTPAHIEFLSGRNFATIATLDDDGAPRQAVAWYALQDDGRILLNSRHPRRWCENLLREGRVAIAITQTDDPYRWLGVTGVVDAVVEDLGRARDDIVALGRRYSEDGSIDPKQEAAFRSQLRVSFLVRITGVHDHLEG